MKYADRVRETTATAGTGTYNLAGPVTGFQSFVTGVGTGALVPYHVDSGGADYEYGLGTVTSGSPDTLARTVVYGSSNAGAAVNWPAGTKSVRLSFSARILSGLPNQAICQGRLTTESGVPISSADRTAQSTLFFTPFNGNLISLYDGFSWKTIEFPETPFALSGLTDAKLYDVWGRVNAGVLTLDLSAAWTSDTVRSQAYALQDGILVKSGDTTRRLLGTIRTTGATTTEDSVTKRFVSNAYNRVWRSLYRSETTSAWTYSTAGGFRQARASAANQVEAVFGIYGASIRLVVACIVQNAAFNGAGIAAVGYDSTTVPDQANLSGGGGYVGAINAITEARCDYRRNPDVGYHKFVWLEKSLTGTSTFYGTDASSNVSGMVGGVES